jgi:hypothetical protein
MSQEPAKRMDDLDLQVVRRIDAACRRFEEDWRFHGRASIDTYLWDVPEQARPALLVELEALASELSRETSQRSADGKPPAAPSTIAEAATITPLSPAPASTAVGEQATLPPYEPRTIAPGSTQPIQPGVAKTDRVRSFGDYEIVREIARGGMGVVFEARQVSLNRKVALKMILSGQLANDMEIRRFYTEAEAAANLDHPSIVPIFEVGQHENQHYFSMGFVDGQSLSQHLAKGLLAARDALGATLYALITGRPPFQAATATDTAIQVISEEPIPPRRLNPSIPRDLETVCLKCLEKDPGKRYSSAGALGKDLRRFLAGEPVVARPVGGLERTWRWCRRNPAVASLAAGMAFALVVGTLVASIFAVRASRSASEARGNLRLANAATKRVREEKQLSDRRLYVAETNLAQQAWRDGNLDLFLELLQAQQPESGETTDFRGFEWYYLDRLRELDLRTFRDDKGPIISMAISPDGRLVASASAGREGAIRLWDTATGREMR